MPRQALNRYDNSHDKGITWIDGAGTRLFHCEVTFASARPMRCTIRALDRTQAKRFAHQRWGGSAREIHILKETK